MKETTKPNPSRDFPKYQKRQKIAYLKMLKEHLLATYSPYTAVSYIWQYSPKVSRTPFFPVVYLQGNFTPKQSELVSGTR